MRLRASTITDHDIFNWTGLRHVQFADLTSRLWDIHPDGRRGRPWGLSFADRLLLVVLALRTNLTERQLASLFSVSQAQVDRVVHDLTGHLGRLLEPPPRDRRDLWIVDGTLIPTRDHTRSAKSKNYRRSANVQVVCRRRDRRVVFVGKAWPGKRHDAIVFRATVPDSVRDHPRLIGDGGYQGVEGVGVPRRGHDGKMIRDSAWRRRRKRRATVEHVLAEMKVYQVLRDCRRRGPGIDEVVSAVAVLHNLRKQSPAMMM